MHRLLACSYGVAATCFAIVLKLSLDHPAHWKGHPVLAFLLGIGIPLAIGASWIAERRDSSKNPRLCDHMILFAPMPGVMAVIYFLFLLNPILGMAYGLGVLLLALIMWRMP